LLAVPFFCGIIIGAVSLSIARRADRWTTAALAPPFVVLFLAILLGTSFPVSSWQGILFALVAMYWAAYRQRLRRLGTMAGTAVSRRLGTALALVILVGAVGWVVGTSSMVSGNAHRVVLRNRINPPVDTRLLTSPLATIRYYVVDHRHDTFFVVHRLPQGSLIRLAALDSYDGIAWRVDQAPRITQSTSLFERVGQSIPVQGSTPPSTVTVEIPSNSPYDDVWLPTVGQTASVTFSGGLANSLREDLRYNSDLATAAIGPGVPSGITYTLKAVVNTSIRSTGSPILASVTDIPKGVVEWATKYGGVAGGDPLAQMQALATKLRAGEYSDGQPGEAQVDPGHGAEEITKFLSNPRPVGDAEQYASALGLMGYALGIPDRVVVGVDCAKVDCNGPITGSMITAWVEVGVGAKWVPVFPTPSSSANADATHQNPEPPANTNSPPPPNLPLRAKSNPAGGSKGVHSNCQTTDTCISSPFLPAWVGPVVGIPFSVLLFIFVIVGGLVGIKANRRKKRRTTGEPAMRVVAGWDELCDLVRDIGGVLPHSATRRESAILVNRAGVAAVAQRADTLVFGPDEVTDQAAEQYWEQLETTRTGILGSLSFSDRWKARLSLSSLQPAARIERVRDLVTNNVHHIYTTKVKPLLARASERFNR
jgi:hypothetical protein